MKSPQRLRAKITARLFVERLENRLVLSASVPNGPFGLSAPTVTSTAVTLNFYDNSADEQNFVVERSTGDGPWVTVGTPGPFPGTGLRTYTDSTDAPATTYAYRVYAVNGPYQSSIAGPISVTTPPAGIPNGPFNLTASAASSKSVKLSFHDNSTNETGFTLERSTAGGPFTFLKTLDPLPGTGLCTYTDATVSALTQYSYRISAMNAAGTSRSDGPAAVSTPTDIRNLLFFGNSFTQNNDVPSLVSSIAAADRHVRPNAFVQASPGWTLADQLTKIAADGANNVIDHSLPAGASWDNVIIQEFSTRPATVSAPPVNGDPAAFRADAAALFHLVTHQSPNAHTVLFETWARGMDNPLYPNSYTNPTAMQWDIRSSYRAAAQDLNAITPDSTEVAPVGEAWKAQNFPHDLYDGPDEYHASKKGSVIAAMVLYHTTYHDDLSDIAIAQVQSLLTANGLSETEWRQMASVVDALFDPAAPTVLTNDAIAPSSADLTWLPVTGVDAYHIERANGNGPFVEVATVGAALNHFNDSGLASDQSYSYRIRASQGGALFDYSNIINVKTLRTSNNDIYIKRDPDGIHADIWIGSAATPAQGSPTEAILIPLASSLTVNGSSAGDELTLDFSTGNPIPLNGATFNGDAGANTLTVIGTSADDTLTATQAGLSFDTTAFKNFSIATSDVPSLRFVGGSGGSDTFNIVAGSYNVDADTATGIPNVSVVVGAGASAIFTDDQHLADLTLNGGNATIVTSARKTLSVRALSINNALLDIANNDLLLDNVATPIATLQEYWRAGYNMHPYNAGFDDEGAGYYDGVTGIISSVAKADGAAGSFKRQVGYIDGNAQNIYGFTMADIGGPDLATNRILVRPVLMGDVNFDGKIDPSDIQVLLGTNKFNKGPGSATDGWIDGDFNGDGVADPTDIQLLLAANTFG